METRNFINDVFAAVNIYLLQIGKSCPIQDADNPEKKLIHLEAQLTLIELRDLLTQHDTHTTLHPGAFLKFLTHRWEVRLKNTRAAYPYNPHCPANLACKELAQQLARYYPESPHLFKILITSLWQKPTPCLSLHSYILNDDNTVLISVRDFFINLIHGRQYLIHEPQRCRHLSPAEIHRIRHHSCEIENIVNLLGLDETGTVCRLLSFSEEEKNKLITNINTIFNDRQEFDLFLTGCDENSRLSLHRALFGDTLTLSSLVNILADNDPILWKFYVNILSNEALISLIFTQAGVISETQDPLTMIKALPSLLRDPLLYRPNHDEQNRAVAFTFLELYLRLRHIMPEYTGFFGMVTGYAKSKKIDKANWLSEQLVAHTMPQLAVILKSNQTVTGVLAHDTLGDFVNQILLLANKQLSTSAVSYLGSG